MDKSNIPSIVDDDRYSEVFLDIEKGDTEKGDIEQENKGSSLGSESISIGDVYAETLSNDHFTNKLAMELETIKNKEEINDRNSWKKKQQLQMMD